MPSLARGRDASGRLHTACQVCMDAEPTDSATTEAAPVVKLMSTTEPSLVTMRRLSWAKVAETAGPGTRTSPMGSQGAAASRRLRMVNVPSPGKCTAARRAVASSAFLAMANTRAPGACPIGSAAPSTDWHRQRPAPGSAPGHSTNLPEDVARIKPKSSQDDAARAPSLVTPSSKNWLLSTGSSHALFKVSFTVETTRPRPRTDNAARSPEGPHARSCGSKRAGQRRAALRGASLFWLCTGRSAIAVAAEPSACAGSTSCSKLRMTSRSFAAISRAVNSGAVLNLRCSSSPPSSSSSSPTPTSWGRSNPGFAGRYRGSRMWLGKPGALRIDGWLVPCVATSTT
mmetsp:Transcript_68341/g.163970  ORF Transcript_68341/g.163970 Transcript_68341/m.163970 type:complete len:343 (+) Transcript_68341:144-1172(+)